MFIRHAKPSDAAAIAHVQIEGWRTMYRGLLADVTLDGMSHEERTAEWTDQLKRAGVITFVGEETSAGVVAFAVGGSQQNGHYDQQGELYAIYILKEWRGQGIGEQLVSRLAESLDALGKRGMLVWVFAQNPHRRFYEKLGGKLVGEQPIQIGHQALIEVAYAWDDLKPLFRPRG